MVRQKSDKLKRSIVLKGMESNVVEEAVVFLKPNINLKSIENKEKIELKNKMVSKELIINEAENVIKEYVERIQKSDYIAKQKANHVKLKILKVTNIITFLLLIVTLIMAN